MKKLLLFTGFLIAFFSASAQTKSGDEQIYTFVEQMPEFPGGQTKMMEYLAQNIIYPEPAVQQGLQGTSFYSFVVNQDGSLSDIAVIKSANELLDQEGLRVLKAMPLWKPGKQNGKTVRVKYTLPVRFQLEDPKPAENQVATPYKEEIPEFPGGQMEMMKFLKKNLKYPLEARKNQIKGSVVVTFIVNTDGSLSDHKVIKSLGYGLDEEALRVVKAMPLWKPGKQNDTAVRVQFTLPVMF